MKLLLKNMKMIALAIIAASFLGCGDDDDVDIPKVIAGFTQKVNQEMGTVTFINTSENATKYTWDFGDESTSTEIDPIKTYVNGTYTVKLTATNNFGGSDTFQDEITILIPEIISFPASFDGENTRYEATLFGGASFEIVDNPDLSGTNTSASKVGAITNSGAAWEGLYFDLGTQIDFASEKSITMNFWSDKVVDVLLKFEEGTGAAVESVVNHTGTGWENLLFNFTTSDKFSRLTLFVDGPGTTAGTFYFDDFEQIATPDTTPPVITLNGNATMVVVVGTTFTDPGATATDNVDGDISANIVVGGDVVDKDTEGTYTITYNVSDAAGNAATEVTRTVIVSSGTEPIIAAPTPTRDAANVISIFSDVYTDVVVDTWRTSWSAADFEDVMIAGNATKKYSNLDFVGVETVANKVDASGMTHVHVDVWSPDFTQFGFKLVDFAASGNSEHQVDFITPNQGEWVSYDIPLSDFTGLTARSDIAQYIFVGRPIAANTIFLDNIYFYNDNPVGGNEPTVAAPAPTRDASNVISIFSDVYTDVTVDTWRTSWSAADFEDVMIAGNATKKYSNLDFVGVETVANKVDASGMTHVHVDIWSPDFTQFGFKLVDFAASGNSEHQVDYMMPNQGEWISYDIPLSDFTGLTARSDIAQYIFVGRPIAASTIFLDNLYFYNDGGGGGGGVTSPTSAAPTPPSRDAADVISIFSNAYTNTTIDTFSASWDDSDVADIQVSGDDIKQYTFTNFAGIDFSGNKFDASAMTHFHMDLWIPDDIEAGKVITIKNVDFGGTNAEVSNFILTVVHTASGNIPALEKGTWVSIDVPITDFTGTTTRSDLAQMVITSNVVNVFMDNIYFYK